MAYHVSGVSNISPSTGLISRENKCRKVNHTGLVSRSCKPDYYYLIHVRVQAIGAWKI
jgi:hypothetical protein